MIQVDAEELSYCPWGITPVQGWEYYLAPACCSADDHFSHPACQPEAWALVAARAKSGEIEVVAGPELTSQGWQVVVRKIKPGYIKAWFTWDIGGDARDVYTDDNYYYVSAYRDGYGWIPKEFWPFSFNPAASGRWGAPHPPFSMGGYWRGFVAIPEAEIQAANVIKDYLWNGGPMPEVDRIDEYKLLRYKAEADAIVARINASNDGGK
jgi:hypothetical protein